MRKWRIEDSEELYNITGWGTSYFGINDKGHVVVTPRRDGVAVDLKELVDELHLIAAAKYMKEKHPEVLLRVNTNGLGELFNKKPIAEEMAKYIDAVSISLNAPTAERYQEVTQPCFENAFPDMLAFAEKAKKLFSSVQFSVVSIISQEEIDASQKLADEMGIPLKVRIYS